MEQIIERLNAINFDDVAESMHGKGYCTVPQVLTEAMCKQIIDAYDEQQHYRKTVIMERYRFGLGEYKYFRYPLPPPITEIRERVYEQLAPVANSWMKALNIDTVYPPTLSTLHELCRDKNQHLPTVLILKYGTGGHNTLHQDLYGEVFFPIQLVLFLNEPGEDYGGGEFVLTQQNPRAQSKAIVLQPKRGDMLLFTTNFRPVKGSKGYYRAQMRHGVSELHWGERHTLGIIFHDALS
ncbi:2OG-Fe(II) oxygenase [Taibaiella soli]|uniref:Prolyl 4-hydroxylase subunit alpha n=1 Tax=Taibaiella soli TaxID=1649169 RepID=A0A2W2A7R8_9BACT|nr:2OG-Fe(II) oxygenase [Taibaiella soli]PZF71301.1 prolyl 4-hydroxylase subunit alpha [Taibaiella soli]